MVQCESTAASDRIGCLTPPWALWLNAEICSRSWKRGTEAPQIPPSRGLTVRDQELRPEARGEKRRAGWAPSSPPWWAGPPGRWCPHSRDRLALL